MPDDFDDFMSGLRGSIENQLLLDQIVDESEKRIALRSMNVSELCMRRYHNEFTQRILYKTREIEKNIEADKKRRDRVLKISQTVISILTGLLGIFAYLGLVK